jgi:hypothetical protein
MRRGGVPDNSFSPCRTSSQSRGMRTEKVSVTGCVLLPFHQHSHADDANDDCQAPDQPQSGHVRLL